MLKNRHSEEARDNKSNVRSNELRLNNTFENTCEHKSVIDVKNKIKKIKIEKTIFK